MKRMRFFLALIVLPAVTMVFAPRLKAAALRADDAATTYKSKCAMCHGADGSGDTPVGKRLGVKNLRSPEVQQQSDEELVAVIRDGKNKMPAFKNTISADQAKGLVGYIRELAKGK